MILFPPDWSNHMDLVGKISRLDGLWQNPPAQPVEVRMHSGEQTYAARCLILNGVDVGQDIYLVFVYSVNIYIYIIHMFLGI